MEPFQPLTANKNPALTKFRIPTLNSIAYLEDQSTIDRSYNLSFILLRIVLHFKSSIFAPTYFQSWIMRILAACAKSEYA